VSDTAAAALSICLVGHRVWDLLSVTHSCQLSQSHVRMSIAMFCTTSSCPAVLAANLTLQLKYNDVMSSRCISVYDIVDCNLYSITM
jgi:hypothetical protein